MRRFANAYRRDATERAQFSPEVEALLVKAREWSHLWGVILYNALHRKAPYPEELGAVSQSYCDWVNADLDGAGTELMGMLPQMYADEATLLLMEMNFHRLNARLQFAWLWLLYGPPEPAVALPFIERARYELAGEALLMAKAREFVVAQDAYFVEEATELRAWNVGGLTELDACVAMLEMTRTDPAILVLPAPAQFEHLAGPANADFIIVDRRRELARGVQVKAQVSTAARDRYDTTRITLIDGSRDLQNTLAMRTDPRRSDKRPVSWPGLISAHYLRDLAPSKLTDLWVGRKALIQQKLAARHYAGTVASRNQEAYQAVADRILHDLDA